MVVSKTHPHLLKQGPLLCPLSKREGPCFSRWVSFTHERNVTYQGAWLARVGLRAIMTAMNSYVASFNEYLTIEKGVADNTLLAYMSDLQQFMGFLGDRVLSASRVSGFSKYLYDREFSATSISRKLSTIKLFCRFLYREGAIGFDMDGIVVKPKLGRRLPEVLSQDEMTALLGATETGDKYRLRDQAILELFYSSGCRVSELPEIRVGHITTAGFFKITGKGQKQRLVPLGSVARVTIEDYVAHERPKLIRDASPDYLFLNCFGQKITRQGVYLIVKKYVRRSGVNTAATPHTLRHSFAGHLLDGDADLREIQALLGHSNIATTQRYTQVSNATLKRQHREFHPRR